MGETTLALPDKAGWQLLAELLDGCIPATLVRYIVGRYMDCNAEVYGEGRQWVQDALEALDRGDDIDEVATWALRYVALVEKLSRGDDTERLGAQAFDLIANPPEEVRARILEDMALLQCAGENLAMVPKREHFQGAGQYEWAVQLSLDPAAFCLSRYSKCGVTWADWRALLVALDLYQTVRETPTKGRLTSLLDEFARKLETFLQNPKASEVSSDELYFGASALTLKNIIEAARNEARLSVSRARPEPEHLLAGGTGAQAAPGC